MAPGAEHAQDAASATINLKWAWATLQKAVKGTKQKIESKKIESKVKIDSVANDDDAWTEIRKLSSVVFGTAIGLVHNAQLDEIGKRSIQELLVRGHRAFTSAIDFAVVTDKLKPEDKAVLDKAVALCVWVVSDFEKLGESKA